MHILFLILLLFVSSEAVADSSFLKKSETTVDTEEQEKNSETAKDYNITPELFRQWRAPRYGTENPTRADNEVWKWIIRSGINAYVATQEMKAPSALDAGPTWCFVRFGQSKTLLPDKRVIYIAGEHEDGYDPDFWIYNDVVVKKEDGSLEIYTYPKGVFPPTDFHTATILGDEIILVGSLGYSGERYPEKTQVLILDTKSYSIRPRATTGENPGWIHEHNAALSKGENELIVKGGKLFRGLKQPFSENIDEWSLDLKAWSWKRLTKKDWPRWELSRSDGKSNHLTFIRTALIKRGLNIPDDFPDGFDQGFIEMIIRREKDQESEIAHIKDLSSVKELYRPSVPHEAIPENEDDDELEVHRIRIGDVVVRYVEGMYGIQLTVEGTLPKETIDQLKLDLSQKFSLLENSPSEFKEIK